MNLLEALRADAADAARRRQKRFTLPPVLEDGPQIVAVCRPLGYVRFRELQDAAELGHGADLDAATDLIAEATVRLEVTVEGAVHDLGDYLISLGAPEVAEPGPTVFDHRLATMLGLAASSRREVVAHLIPDEMARVAVSNAVVAWIGAVAEEVAEEAAGE